VRAGELYRAVQLRGSGNKRIYPPPRGERMMLKVERINQAPVFVDPKYIMWVELLEGGESRNSVQFADGQSMLSTTETNALSARTSRRSVRSQSRCLFQTAVDYLGVRPATLITGAVRPKALRRE
jgi:hypothetical protein